MNAAERLNTLIELAEKGFPDAGNIPFENEAELAKLNRGKLFFTASVLGMQAISHVIEEQTLQTPKPFKLYSSFQKLSRFQYQKERYLKITATDNPVCIFGLPNIAISAVPNLNVIALDPPASDSELHLSRFWFVVLHCPNLLSMALVAYELPKDHRAPHLPDKLIYRNFRGFWTHDQTIVSQVAEILDDHINYPLFPSLSFINTSH